MTPRRPSRRRRKDAVLVAVQHLRLERIARGEMEPASLREACFLAMLDDGGRLALRDFVVSPILFLTEQVDCDLEAAGAD